MKDRCIFCGAALEPRQANNPNFSTGKTDGRLRELLLAGACCPACNSKIVIPARVYLWGQEEKGGAAGEKL